MIEQLAKNLVDLKKEFVKIYDGKSQVQELIPKSTSETFSINQQMIWNCYISLQQRIPSITIHLN